MYMLYETAMAMSATPMGATRSNRRGLRFISSRPAKLPFSKTCSAGNQDQPS